MVRMGRGGFSGIMGWDVGFFRMQGEVGERQLTEETRASAFSSELCVS